MFMNATVNSLRNRARLVLLPAAAYALMDLPVRMIGLLPPGLGLKNFLPVTLGLFLGPYGSLGGCLGCALSGALLSASPLSIATECACVLVVGCGMWGLWHLLSASHRVQLKRPGHYLRYALILAGLSAVCGLLSWRISGEDALTVALTYALSGFLVGVPVNILLGSLLCVEPVLPPGYSLKDDAAFDLDPGPDALEAANEILEETAGERGLHMKRVFEVQSCIEELSIRVLGAEPEAKIRVQVRYDDAISLRMAWRGRKYNPLHISRDEDEIDVAGLKIIRHRALRASFRYQDGRNSVHVVI